MMRDSPLAGLWIGARLDHKVAAATIRADKKLYQRQIEATNAEIDAPVYELYGLSDEEIAIVEGGTIETLNH